MAYSKVFKIVGISGSLRKDSFNSMLIRAFGAAAKEKEFVDRRIEFDIVDWSKYNWFT